MSYTQTIDVVNPLKVILLGAIAFSLYLLRFFLPKAPQKTRPP
ncbi:hypothetical protein BJP36_42585 [Moorena producens JHB]|uniref:Uncharacterized protein n=1 Tax=Moorena producens (strain JHB) TaxID=1454205 RepID=A0A9Q9UVQ2_MOOP1|nr:hypothetical protein [Moorena producens]WAN69046.1 hypothetical protein BJP36_42585 [Moorena producens JHB]